MQDVTERSGSAPTCARSIRCRARFAAGLVVSGVWLHVITPLQTAVLIAAYGVVNQAYGIWKVRHALRWRRVLPFVLGGAVGVPLGAYSLTYIDPAHLPVGVGVLLILYASYNLARPALKPITSNARIDAAVGVLNGLLGGLTGLGGVISTIWVQLGGGPKDAQRAVFQPVLFITMAPVLLGAQFTCVSVAQGSPLRGRPPSQRNEPAHASLNPMTGPEEG